MQQRRLAQRLHNVALLDVRPGGTVQDSRTDQPVSFRELASAQLPRLYSIARRLVGDDAEDAVQECLLKGFQRYGQLKAAESGPAWLTTILVNSCRDRVAARRPYEIDFDEVEKFSLYRKIAYEDPFPYSDSLHLDFLGEFGPEDVRAVLMDPSGLPQSRWSPRSRAAARRNDLDTD